MKERWPPGPHGVKRRADDDLQNDQRLAKRFDRLNLEQYGLLKVPIEAPLPTPPIASFSPPDTMHIDDTRDRVFIHNLEEEIKAAEAEEQSSIFLPDVEKKLSKVPHGVLASSAPSGQDKQMVLYKIPASLTVPEEKDSVRRAIIESRERARAEQAKKAEASTGAAVAVSNPDSTKINSQDTDENVTQKVQDFRDPDAMDIG